MNKVTRIVTYPIGVIFLILIIISDVISTRARNKSGANREF